MQPDRVVHLTWERPGTLSPALTLIHELTGPHSNIIFVDAEDIILDALKHAPRDAKHQRSILPGSAMSRAGAAPHRLRLSDVTPEHLLRLHQQDDFDDHHLQRPSLVCPQCWYESSATALRATHNSVGNSCKIYDSGTTPGRCHCRCVRLLRAGGI